MSVFSRIRRRSAPPPTPAEAETETEVDAETGKAVKRKNPVLAVVWTVLAGLLVFVTLVIPEQVVRLVPGTFVPGAFVRIPIEGLLGLALLIALPVVARRIVAILLGIVLGLLTMTEALDAGFWNFLNRQFDLVADWALLDDGVNFLKDTFGRPAALAAAAGAVVLAVGVLVLLVFSVLRLARVAGGRRRVSFGVLGVLLAGWIALTLLGTQIVPGIPVASRADADRVQQRALLIRTGLRDQKAFTKAIEVDSFRNTPGSELLTGLRGKDVIFSLVESYGRSALEDPVQAAQVDPALTAGTAQLKAAGFAAKSGFLTSSTFGGYSWLAHSTLQSGLWIDNQQRYRTLVGTDRLTLTKTFARAGWQTVAVEPDNTYAWPEGTFYGYQRVWDSRNLGYKGPHFSWSTMPDQYTLSAFQREEYGKPHAPMMAEVTLTSSHTPWAPIPQLVDWDAVGDGSIYAAQQKAGNKPDEVWKDSTRVKTEFAKSVAYSVGSLVSWVATYGKDNLVLVFLGDHQAAPIVSGKEATHDVPITIVAHDPAVLAKIAPWGWQDGLRPNPQAPVTRMDAFRDKFLTAFGPQG